VLEKLTSTAVESAGDQNSLASGAGPARKGCHGIQPGFQFLEQKSGHSVAFGADSQRIPAERWY
jgi:hypothetical protein